MDQNNRNPRFNVDQMDTSNQYKGYTRSNSYSKPLFNAGMQLMKSASNPNFECSELPPSNPNSKTLIDSHNTKDKTQKGSTTLILEKCFDIYMKNKGQGGAYKEMAQKYYNRDYRDAQEPLENYQHPKMPKLQKHYSENYQSIDPLEQIVHKTMKKAERISKSVPKLRMRNHELDQFDTYDESNEYRNTRYHPPPPSERHARHRDDQFKETADHYYLPGIKAKNQQPQGYSDRIVKNVMDKELYYLQDTPFKKYAIEKTQQGFGPYTPYKEVDQKYKYQDARYRPYDLLKNKDGSENNMFKDLSIEEKRELTHKILQEAAQQYNQDRSQFKEYLNKMIDAHNDQNFIKKKKVLDKRLDKADLEDLMMQQIESEGRISKNLLQEIAEKNRKNKAKREIRKNKYSQEPIPHYIHPQAAAYPQKYYQPPPQVIRVKQSPNYDKYKFNKEQQAQYLPSYQDTTIDQSAKRKQQQNHIEDSIEQYLILPDKNTDYNNLKNYVSRKLISVESNVEGVRKTTTETMPDEVVAKTNNKRNSVAQSVPRRYSQIIKAKSHFERLRDQRKLRIRLWHMVFPIFLINSIISWTDERVQETYKYFSKHLNEHMSRISEYVAQASANNILYFARDKASMVFVEKKKIPLKSLNQRIQTLKSFTDKIFASLFKQSTPEALGKELIEFFSNLTSNGSIIPVNYLTRYELDRLQFSIFGTLKKPNQDQIKMILGFRIFLRYFLLEMVMKPWNYISGLTYEETNIKNMLNIGSIFYHLFLDIHNKMPIFKKDGGRKPAPIKVKYTALPVNADIRVSVDVEPQGNSQSELIPGFYTKEQLSDFFENFPDVAKDYQQKIKEWIDKIYQNIKVHQDHQFFVKEAFRKYYEASSMS